MTDQTCPPLSSGSVDMNALHDKIMSGTDPATAAAEATTSMKPLTPEEVKELPSLSGKTRAELEAIAADEEVELHAGMTNPERVSAIEAKRATLIDPAAAGSSTAD